MNDAKSEKPIQDPATLRDPEEIEAYMASLDQEISRPRGTWSPVTEEELRYFEQHGTLPEFSLQEPLRKAS